MRIGNIIVCAALALAAPAVAEEVALTPGVAADPGQRLLDAARTLEGELGPGRLTPSPKATSLFVMMAQRYRGDDGGYLFVTPTRRITSVCRSRVATMSAAGLQDALARCLQALTAEAKAAGPGAAPAKLADAPAAAPLPPPSRQANWSQVQGVYFRSITIFGVGGMMVQDFEPVVLFKDGSFYEPGDTPIEALDIAASRASEPRRWGRWTGGGASFTLTSWGPKAKPVTHKLQKGSFFKAFPAEALGGKLDATYSRVSGGGNSSLGGTVTIGSRADIRFAPDGSFGRKSGGGGFGGGAAVSSRSSGGGRYAIKGHRIEMTGPDGRLQRRFFAVGSEGSPPRADPQIIFIGDQVYTIMDGK